MKKFVFQLDEDKSFDDSDLLSLVHKHYVFHHLSKTEVINLRKVTLKKLQKFFFPEAKLEIEKVELSSNRYIYKFKREALMKYIQSIVTQDAISINRSINELAQTTHIIDKIGKLRNILLHDRSYSESPLRNSVGIYENNSQCTPLWGLFDVLEFLKQIKTDKVVIFEDFFIVELEY